MSLLEQSKKKPLSGAKPMLVIQIEDVIPDDYKAMHEIFVASFESDRQTQLKNLDGYSDDFESSRQYYESMAARPDKKIRLLKAVDGKSGEILGTVHWMFHGYGKNADQEARKEQDAKEDQEIMQPEEKKEEVEEKKEDERELTTTQRLEKVTNADMDRWMRILMPPGAKCMVIVGISVKPSAQGNGVGSALVKWGTDQADRDKVYCWVHSSEAGHRMFEKHDFRVEGTLVVDLDEYTTAKAPDGDKWGRYTFRYMKRLPQPVRT